MVDIKKDEVTNRRPSKYVSIDDNGINKELDAANQILLDINRGRWICTELEIRKC